MKPLNDGLKSRFPAAFMATKEVFNHRSFFASFVLSLSIGLCGYILVDALKSSLSSYLDLRSKSILNADFAISSNFPIEAEKKKF